MNSWNSGVLALAGLTLGAALGATATAMWFRGCAASGAQWTALEYWLNRYQGAWSTIAAALAAITVAYIAAQPVYSQLEEMRRQSGIAATSILRERLKELKDRRDILNELYGEAVRLHFAMQAIFDNLDQKRARELELRKKITDYNFKILNEALQEESTDEFGIIRAGLTDKIEKILLMLGSGPYSDPSLHISSHYQNSFTDFSNSVSEYDSALLRDIKLIYREINFQTNLTLKNR